MSRRHPTILDRAVLVRRTNSLDRATALHLAAARVNRQPGRLGQKTILRADLIHQPLAAVQFREALKYVGVDLIAKAEILRLRMFGQQFRLPSDKPIPFRYKHGNRSAATQIELHPEAFEVADAHRTIAATTAEKCLETGFLTVPCAC